MNGLRHSPDSLSKKKPAISTDCNATVVLRNTTSICLFQHQTDESTKSDAKPINQGDHNNDDQQQERGRGSDDIDDAKISANRTTAPGEREQHFLIKPLQDIDEEEQQEQQKEQNNTPLELDKKVNSALKLLQHYFASKSASSYNHNKNNPLKEMNEYYQKMGCKGLQSCFKVHEVPRTPLPPYFFYTLKCPLTEKEYRSGIPLALFLLGEDSENESNANKYPNNANELKKLTKEIFGIYDIQDGTKQVSFSTKKAAKKAIAIAIMQDIKPYTNEFGSCLISHANNLQANDGDEQSQSSLEDQSDDDNNSNSNSNDNMLSNDEDQAQTRPSIPSWCNELYDLGVTSMNISYEEYVHNENSKNQFDEWEAQPIKLCCVLQRPNLPSFMGKPEMTKEMARESAVSELIESIKKSDGTAAATNDIPKKKSTIKIKQERKVFPESGGMIRYWKPLPKWAIGKPKRTMYLYKLTFQSTRQDGSTDFLPNRMGIDKLTPLGILLPYDLPSFGPFRAEFPLIPRGKGGIQKKGNVEMCSVELSGVTIVCDLDETKLSMLREFNEKLGFWFTDYSPSGTARFIAGKERLPYETDPRGRTYMFVPLLNSDGGSIDFDLIQRVVDNKLEPFLRHHRGLDLVGSWMGVGKLILLSALVLFVTNFLILKQWNLLLSIWTHAVILTLELITISVLFVTFISSASKQPMEVLKNRFFVEVGKGIGQVDVFVLPKSGIAFSTKETGRSKYCLCHGTKDMEMNKQKYKIDLTSDSFITVYRKKFNVDLQFPNSPLIQLSRVIKHGDCDLLFNSNNSPTVESKVFLFPEMVHMLPLPRDLVYIYNLAPRFMSRLERVIEIEQATNIFQQKIASQAPTSICDVPSPSASSLKAQECIDQNNLARLIGLATSSGIRMQRMEHLGDAILGYIIGLNTFSHNFDLTWDIIDLRDIYSEAVSNRTLSSRAMNIGLGHIYDHRGFWKSVYTAASSWNQLFFERSSNSLPCPNGRTTFRLENKLLSDVLEALLAALYLYWRSDGKTNEKNGGRMFFGLLELVDLPIGRSCNSRAPGNPWFLAKGACLTTGYPFESDVKWSRKLEDLIKLLASREKISINFNENARRLLNSLLKSADCAGETNSEMRNKLKTGNGQLLLSCALYDDSFADEHGLVEFALLRDSLFRVGTGALQMSISNEIYHRFPDASEHDMTLQRKCAFNHDVVVYIMLKAGLHRFLYDYQSNTSIFKFLSEMEAADRRGHDLWKRNNGWSLGISEFQKRCNQNLSPDSKVPKYMGLGGGRLLGSSQRLDDSISEDLNFSMKAIVGALVLIIGVDGMWLCLAPLWDEVLLLSAQETHQVFGQVL